MGGQDTIVARRRVRAGREGDAAAWLEQLSRGVAAQFGGRLGAEFHRPAAPGAERRSVFRFDSLTQLDAFERSDVRARMLAEAAPLFATAAAWERRTGLAFWFDPPRGMPPPQPRPHRMALVRIAMAFMLVLTPILTLGPLMAGWPPALRVLVTVTCLATSWKRREKIVSVGFSCPSTVPCWMARYTSVTGMTTVEKPMDSMIQRIVSLGKTRIFRPTASAGECRGIDVVKDRKPASHVARWWMPLASSFWNSAASQG